MPIHVHVAWTALLLSMSDPVTEGPVASDHALIADANAAAAQYGCDPIETAIRGVERPSYTKEQRLDTYRRVMAECRRLGGTDLACDLAKVITIRESSGRAGVRHRLPQDAAFALDSYINQGHRYGWRVTWPWDERWSAPGVIQFSTVVLTALGVEPDQNPHYQNPMRWTTGLGPLSFSPSTHLWRSGDPTLPPEWLCVPENSTKLLMDTYRRAVTHYKAETLTEVNSVFAGAIAANRPKKRPEKDKRFCDRLASYGMDCNAKPDLFR